MKNKTVMKKTTIMVLCLCTLAAIVFVGTYGYRMYTQDALTNTFIIGDLKATLTEEDSVTGNKVQHGNTYELAWDTSYRNLNVALDVEKASGEFYAFIVVNNELKDVESAAISNSIDTSEDYTPLHDQIVAHGWEVTSTNGNVTVYFQKIETVARSYPVAESFRTAKSFSYDSFTTASPKIEFTFYAIEKRDLNASEAWELLKATYPDKIGSY